MLRCKFIEAANSLYKAAAYL